MSKLPQHIEESFDTLFNSLGYDHVDTCTCGFMEDRKCISGRDKLKSFIATLLEEEKKKIIKNIKKMYLPEIKETGGQPENDEIAQSINDILSSIINLIKEDK